MKGQTALTFEKPRTTEPVHAPSFKESNDIMIKMEADRRPKADPNSNQEPTTIDEITKLLRAFENKIDQKISSLATPKTPSSVPKSTLVCYYCHREGHGTGRCQELQKDLKEKLVEQRGNNYFLPNGALIPFDSSRPIRHVVASYQPSPPVKASLASFEFRSSCGTLQPWYPPAISSSSLAGTTYQSDPARKQHEEPKPHKAPSLPTSILRKPVKRRSTLEPPSSDVEDMEVEKEPLMERFPDHPDPSPSPQPSNPILDSASPELPPSTQPKV